MQDADEFINRLIRIETRVARIQQHLGLPTRMDSEDLKQLDEYKEQPVGKRLARIETRVYKTMEALGVNPRTGRKS